VKANMEKESKSVSDLAKAFYAIPITIFHFWIPNPLGSLQ